jgi:hypothetical protein
MLITQQVRQLLRSCENGTEERGDGTRLYAVPLVARSYWWQLINKD